MKVRRASKCVSIELEEGRFTGEIKVDINGGKDIYTSVRLSAADLPGNIFSGIQRFPPLTPDEARKLCDFLTTILDKIPGLQQEAAR